MDSQLSATIDAPLSDLERRFIGNFGQPRNLYHISDELRRDEHTVVNVPNDAGEFEVQNFMAHPDDIQALLDNALGKGWVVEVDDQSNNPGKIAAAAQRAKGVYDWTDESAKLFEDRLLVPHRAWRLPGPHYIITAEGIQKLKEPVGPTGMLSTDRIQAIVDAEWARTHQNTSIEAAQGDPDWDEPLADALLLDEFTTWFNLIADECERVNGTRPTSPAGGDGTGAGWTDVYENRILDHENQKTALPALVAPWFMALTILAFTDTDTPTTSQDGSHKPTYTGYADKSVAAADMNAAASGSAANANAITFAACTGGSSAILGFANKETNGTTGDLRKYGTCTSTTVSTTQTPAQFAAAAYTTTAD